MPEPTASDHTSAVSTGPSDPTSPCPHCTTNTDPATTTTDSTVGGTVDIGACRCDNACGADRCPARDGSLSCAGGCGRRTYHPRIACLWCWDLLPFDLRQEITRRRGAPRAALIAHARRWYNDRIHAGPADPPADGEQAAPRVRFSLAQPGDFVPSTHCRHPR